MRGIVAYLTMQDAAGYSGQRWILAADIICAGKNVLYLDFNMSSNLLLVYQGWDSY